MSEELRDVSVLLDRWHEGEEEALHALLEDHLPWVRAQVRRHLTPLLRAKAESVDFAQDAILQFLRFAPRFSISESRQFRALLLKVVQNTLHNRYDWFTAKRRAISREQPLPSDSILSLDAPNQRMATPSKIADHNEREAWIRLGLEFLEPEDQELIVLRQWEDLSWIEIGEKLGLTKDAARMRYNRAVDHLSDKIWDLRNGNLDKVL